MRGAWKLVVGGVAFVVCCTVAFATPYGSQLVQGLVSDASAGQVEAGVEVGSGSPKSSATASVESRRADADGTYKDGVYHASAKGKIGTVPVTVVVEDGAIDQVLIGQNSEAPAMAQKAAASVVPQIIEYQSVEGVDAVAGATITSDAIIEAVGKALELAQA